MYLHKSPTMGLLFCLLLGQSGHSIENRQTTALLRIPTGSIYLPVSQNVMRCPADATETNHEESAIVMRVGFAKAKSTTSRLPKVKQKTAAIYLNGFEFHV
jgi:hypothetical protein